MNATRAAVEEGIVAAGGVAPLRGEAVLNSFKPANDDQKAGIEIVRRAIRSPAWLIAENAGVEGAIVVGKIRDRKEPNWGYDAQDGRYKDLVGAGIIDPIKVVRTALQDAASVAGLLITTEAMVAEKPEKKAPAPAAPDMGGMDF